MRIDEWDARYRQSREDTSVGLWSSEPPRRLTDALAKLRPGAALDLATGDGRTALWMAEHGWQVTGVDFSREALLTAEDRGRQRGLQVKWVEADVTTWQPDRDFDVVVVAYLHLPEPDIITVLRRAATWVTPVGELLVLGHDVQNLDTGAPGPQDPGILYTPDLLSRAVSAALEILECRTVTRDTAADPESPNETPQQAVDTFLRARRVQP